MEKFHLASDSPSFPNTIFGRIRFEGQLDESLARTTIHHLLNRHLLMGKTVARSGSRLHWVFQTDGSGETADGPDGESVDRPEDQPKSRDTAIDRVLTWQRDVDFSSPNQIQLQNQSQNHSPNRHHQGAPPRIDIDHHHGLHIWVLVGANQTTILSALHHAAGDGAGGVQFLSDFCQIYDNLYAGRDWESSLRKLKPAQLLGRGRLGLLSWDYLRHLWKQPIALLGMLKFFGRRFLVFQPHKLTRQPSVNLPGIVGRWIDQDTASLIQSFADRKNVRVNSVVMAAVFKATQDWLQQSLILPGDEAGGNKDTAQQRSNRKWIRMLLPISYRSKSDLRLPMTNKATLVQIDRNADQMKNGESFLYYLNREIDIVVGWQFDKIFLMAVNLMARFPKWLNRAASDPKANGTIVFTNLGEPFRIKDARRGGWMGPLRWRDFDLVGPVRSEMPVNFTLQRHREDRRYRYRLSLHFDRRVISEDQANQFLAAIDRSIFATIGSPTEQAATA